jgi:predicted nucleic acid-binding protein
MRTIAVFVDTSTVNSFLDMDMGNELRDSTDEEDRLYLSRIVEQYVRNDIVRLVVNPTVEQEIKKTTNPQRRDALLIRFNQFHFTAFNKTVFPFVLPATLFSSGEKETTEQLFEGLPNEFRKDEKILADAVFNQQIEILLTADRKHLANDRFRNRLESVGLDKKIKVLTPKELFEYLKNMT